MVRPAGIFGVRGSGDEGQADELEGATSAGENETMSKSSNSNKRAIALLRPAATRAIKRKHHVHKILKKKLINHSYPPD